MQSDQSFLRSFGSPLISLFVSDKLPGINAAPEIADAIVQAITPECVLFGVQFFKGRRKLLRIAPRDSLI